VSIKDACGYEEWLLNEVGSHIEYRGTLYTRIFRSIGRFYIRLAPGHIAGADAERDYEKLLLLES
jgi:hypothetical protein